MLVSGIELIHFARYREVVMRPIIVLNDPTSDGGKVLEGSSTSLINGLPVARVGDKVSCPHGVGVIVTGDASTVVDGRAVARDGDLISCGARLIATQLDSGIL